MKDKKLPSSIPEGANSTLAFSSFDAGIDEQEAGLPDEYSFAATDDQTTDFGYHGGALSVEEKKEFLVITRNSVDILSSMLNAGTEQMPVKDDLMLSMVEKCKESEPIIQRVIESIGDDESLLFEALSLHDELQQVLSKYQELSVADPQPVAVLVADASTLAGPQQHNPFNETDEQRNLGVKKSEVGI